MCSVKMPVNVSGSEARGYIASSIPQMKDVDYFISQERKNGDLEIIEDEEKPLVPIPPNKNIITRAVGLEQELQVDCFRKMLHPGDRVLLCSDGLTDMLEDEQIRRIIDKKKDVRSAAEKLVKAANDNGGRDNIAVIVIDPFT